MDEISEIVFQLVTVHLYLAKQHQHARFVKHVGATNLCVLVQSNARSRVPNQRSEVINAV